MREEIASFLARPEDFKEKRKPSGKCFSSIKSLGFLLDHSGKDGKFNPFMFKQYRGIFTLNILMF